MHIDECGYYAPQTRDEALKLTKQLGNKAKILAGGTDLLIMLKEKMINPESLVNIKEINEFQGISYEPGKGLVIGACTRIKEIELSDIIRAKYYALATAAGELGSPQVRAMATIGGNICHSSPAAETTSPLVALGAKVLLSSVSGDREMPLEEFILGNRKNALWEGEILTKFMLPEPAPQSASRYWYIGLRSAMEIDAVNMAVNLALENDYQTVKDVKLVMGSVSPGPVVSVAVPAILAGQKINGALVDKAAAAACNEARPIDDIRATAEYRCEVVEVLARRLLKEAYDAAREG